jgi:hypothetical protein
VRILEFGVKQLRNKDIPMVKVLWKHHSQGEATWETETRMRQKYPELFQSPGMEFWGQNS